MTHEKAQADFNMLMDKNGFTIVGYTGDTGVAIYYRTWSKQDDTLEIRVMLSYTYPLITVKRNGEIAGDIIRDYSNPMRAMAAIHAIVKSAGYEM